MTDPAVLAISWLPVLAALLSGAVFASYGGVLAERGLRASIAGRSRCVCGRTLRGWENIPVVSWLVLRGRARCCSVRIPTRYVVTEAAAGVLGAGIGLVVGWPGVAVAAVAGVGVALLGARGMTKG